ncbi:hypothetical protein FOB72_17195 (plasmid) [Cupriavidus pauculus]|uniref:Uncharacterized protein n=1 Tax=Cupriavidus pauculus TaxID=82633 RepID=A0A5P2H7E3_9BURK|nr:hypothetical protein [Cupriavidus pauculus]QET03906.1 hypothetical protein FOB72_17195 [Cupriavidus pauculus]
MNIRHCLTAVLIALAGHASGATFGDWQTGVTDDGNLYAGVVNDSQSALMKVCIIKSGNCVWFLVTATRCEPGARSPTLINSALGATTTDLICDQSVSSAPNSPAQYRYAIANYELLDQVANGGKPFGLAVGLESGRFAVFRFSTNGAKQALGKLSEAAIRLYNKQQSPSSNPANRDSLL